jgi:hypothetical protein
LVIECDDAATQEITLVMPQSTGHQASTWATFTTPAATSCRFAVHDGFNMSYLANFSHYTGGEGGASGPLNEADIGDLHIAAWDTPPSTP